MGVGDWLDLRLRDRGRFPALITDTEDNTSSMSMSIHLIASVSLANITVLFSYSSDGCKSLNSPPDRVFFWKLPSRIPQKSISPITKLSSLLCHFWTKLGRQESMLGYLTWNLLATAQHLGTVKGIG